MTDLFYLRECSSTQEKIGEFIPVENPASVAVCTFNQTKGKGQYGNSWESGKNLNIAYSLAVPTSSINLPDHLFNFHTAVLVADFLANLTTQKVQIKWPNDIIIKNKKIAGLLVEKKMLLNEPFFVFGIGLNVLQEDFENLSKAGSLLTQTGVLHNLEILTQQLHQYLVENISKNVNSKKTLKQLNKNLFRKDLVSVFEINQIRQNGIIKEVDEAGFLMVDLENDGLKKFFHKEIELLY
ncbi:BirA family transcriptional regulator, biotin operon repressor / biotin-[acetyl-CoA-carboxylase] ligase [Kaistella treverensis]|uniref:BirA family transcriptional regulator, biotin operon repressor / biotin-[acetyl-CoA-carboxylase] ligase n=1 Tax=Kaistella treverensis TaxID=631455 RepID=A0A1I3M4N3_9FLAO|nr:biotin--[acetyl-CoA-carboxylase] ligase [Kaistella treverensis]SFI91887.1 BirA family transcriptional regulator, biotin operon repressor / biotin-[acetyl-CoA-carboxylase] ligase [Kaistella treverensis]